MDQSDARNHPRPPATFFGLARDQRQPGTPLAVNADTTAWEIYNDRAFAIDKELIKDWNDSLNTLLIFAALYSAVITAFIIESMKLLNEDPSETTRDILLVITRQLSNNSIEAFEPVEFVAPGFAVRVNYYFFLSISCSLVAALGAVLALQWVGSYDAGLNQSSPEKRALQRHFRYQGIEKWKMVQIIAFLPVLIFLALLLFFIGLSDWLWNVHKGIAGIAIAGLVFGASLFFITTLISMIYVGAPFRTPPSRSLPRLLTGINYSLVTLLANLTLKNGIEALLGAPKKLSAMAASATRILERCKAALGFAMKQLGSPHPQEPFEIREQRHIQSIVDMQREALLWLVNRVDVLPHTTKHFQAIIREVLLLPPDQIVDPRVERAPWDRIFSLLLGPYLMRDKDGGFSDDEIRDLEPKLQAFSLLWTVSTSESFSFMKLLDVTRSATSRSIRQATLLADAKQHDNIRYLFEDLRTVVASVGSLPTHFLVAHLLKLQSRQMKEANQKRILIDFSYRRATGYQSLSQALYCDLQDAASSNVIPQVMMEIVLDILALRYFNSKPPGSTPLERYLLSLETILRDDQAPGDKKTAEDIHGAIVSQILGLALQSIRQAKRPRQSHLLYNLAQLLRANPSYTHPATTIVAILQVLEYWKFTLWKPGTRLQTAQIYAYILPTPYSLNGIDWGDWTTHFYVGIDKLLQEKEWRPAINRQLLWRQAGYEAQWNGPKVELSVSQINRLSLIRDPITWLYASAGCRSRWVYFSPAQIATAGRDSWNDALGWWCYDRRDAVDLSPSELAFIRATALVSPVNMFYLVLRLANIQTVDGHPMLASDWYSVLQQPVMGILLRGGNSGVSSLQLDHHLYGQDFLDNTLKVLLRVSVQSWFFEEFSAADGLSWLLRMVTGHRSFLETALAIVCLCLEHAHQENEVVQWMVCLHQMLSSVKPTDPPRTIENVECFLDAINIVYLCQEHCWLAERNPSPEPGPDPPDPPASGDSRSEKQMLNRHMYVRNWTEDRWERWRNMKEEIMDGLRRGFIGLGPSSLGARFCRDPDGICSDYSSIGGHKRFIFLVDNTQD